MVSRNSQYSGAWGFAVIKNECFLVQVKTASVQGYEVVKYRVLDHGSRSFLVDLTEGYVDLSRPGAPMPTVHVSKAEMISFLNRYTVRCGGPWDTHMVELERDAFSDFLNLSTSNGLALQHRYDRVSRWFRLGARQQIKA